MSVHPSSIVDPERQFVGCLLWLPRRTARRVLAGMRADDLDHPMPAQVLQFIIEVVAAGHAPAPVTVYAHATTTGRVVGEQARHRLGRWLADTYGDSSALPADTALRLKTVVLEAAWRRAVAEHAHRLQHAAENSPTDVLAELVDNTDRLGQLWQRYRDTIAADPTTLEVAA